MPATRDGLGRVAQKKATRATHISICKRWSIGPRFHAIRPRSSQTAAILESSACRRFPHVTITLGGKQFWRNTLHNWQERIFRCFQRIVNRSSNILLGISIAI